MGMGMGRTLVPRNITFAMFSVASPGPRRLRGRATVAFAMDGCNCPFRGPCPPPPPPRDLHHLARLFFMPLCTVTGLRY